MFLFLYAFACNPELVKNEDTAGVILVDNDGDGYFSDEDCNDLDANIYPTTTEICDGIDNNCDGIVDEEVLNTFYADSDGDGFGNPEIMIESCELRSGYVDNGSDCDDTHSQKYPGAEEICDQIDNNCDENIDEGLEQDFYVDNDGDGIGSEEVVQACVLTEGISTLSGDCDDENPELHPLIVEICDDIDNNCNGDIDEGLLTTFYLDQDSDGFGSMTESVERCDMPEGYVERGDDCNDLETMIHPNNYELCDGVDNNCDGTIDVDAEDRFEIYVDADNDGFGSRDDVGELSCTLLEGFATNNDDCDDAVDTIHPNADEICDGIDNDCDDNTDEDDAIDRIVWFVDTDNDGFGSSDNTIVSCSQPVDYVQNADDCDDDIDTIHPDADEICDDIDNDCDGLYDDLDEGVLDDNKIQMFLDSDNDGYGDDSDSILRCSLQIGYAILGGDCDDTNSFAYSDQTLEICDGSDNNCNGNVDEGVKTIFYADNDTDGYGNIESASEFCSLPESGYSENALDCDDSDIDVFIIEGGDSASEHCASPSCETIMNVQDSPNDGVYWIRGSNTIFEAYCNMTSNDGGWTLAAKVTSGSDSKWTHDSESWFVAGNHFNENDFDITSGESKYQSFDEIAVSEILVVDPNSGNLFQIETSGSSLQDIFSNTPQSTDPTLSEFSIVDSSAISYIGFTTQWSICEGNVNGFISNQHVYLNYWNCYSGNGCSAHGEARIGFWGSGSNSYIWSQTSDCSIGLGLKTTGYQGGSVGGTTFGDLTQIWIR